MPISADILARLPDSRIWADALRNRSLVPADPAVYVIWTDDAVPRLHGATNVLYIGSTKRLGGATDRARLYAYTYPSGRHARLIKRRTETLIADGHPVSLRWLVLQHHADARRLESTFLQQHLDEHLEFPAFNGKV
jgi:hypothetical protein